MSDTKRFLVTFDVEGDVYVETADLTFDQQQALSEHFAISNVIPVEKLMKEEASTTYENLFGLSEDL